MKFIDLGSHAPKSFQNKSLWMPNGDVGYEKSPRNEPKRLYNWIMDTHTPDQPDWFRTKKQALESFNGHPTSVFQKLNFPRWEISPDFESASGFFGLSRNNPSSNMDFRALCQDQPQDSLTNLPIDPTYNNANGSISFISMSPTLKRGYKDINPVVHDSFIPINRTITRETTEPGVVPIGTTSSSWSERNADSTVNAVVNIPASISKSKKPKKNLSNCFPTNVKSLLSTGILDGVPVKYVSWGRDKSLRGIIKGTSYLCDCSGCKLSKAVNAFEFERHAGCKTKHPNDHIHFCNGKTVYAVVQELKSIPQQNLFEALQTVTGSPLNENKFHAWRESYGAATHGLEHINQKNKLTTPSSRA